MFLTPFGRNWLDRRYYGVSRRPGGEMRNRGLPFVLGVFLASTWLFAAVSGQSPNARFGKWKLKSDAPAPASNVMTYEPFGDKGMKITIDAVNRDGVASQWHYTTMFDGKDEPITGNPGADTG